MSPTELPEVWAKAWLEAGEICERLERRGAHALRIEADGRPVYDRLLIPSMADLERHNLTPEGLLKGKIAQLCEQCPESVTVTLLLLWGGLEGVKLRKLVTFEKVGEHAY